ncbi:MAG: Uma2 family endonuclease [Bacteroidota bacterium]
MSTAEKIKTYTVDEYFALDAAAEYHYEYNDGQVYAMSGGTIVHGIIIANIIGELREKLKGSSCMVASSDVRVETEKGRSYSHPDAVVFCGTPQTTDNRKDTLLNPTLVIEVLSESTAAYDRGGKFRKYRGIPGFREYLLVEQDTLMVDRFYRKDNGIWVFDGTEYREDKIELQSLGVTLEVAEIYRGVSFPNE